MESKEKKQKKKHQQQFDFCKVCRRNHDQGRAHIYFPNHKKSLSSLLSSFISKLSHIRSFLRYPPTTPPLPPPVDSSLWCIFCDSLISLPCENVISHLASEEHLKNVRDFLRKYGGGMDRVDSFRVSEAELLKWEKSCKSLKSASSSSKEVSSEPSKGMRVIRYLIQKLLQLQTLAVFHVMPFLCQRASRETWILLEQVLYRELAILL